METLPDIFPFQQRHDELAAQMADAAFYANPRRAADVTREHQRLHELIESHRRHTKLARDIAEAEALGRDPAADDDLRELVTTELPAMKMELAALHHEILQGMIRPEPTDSRNTVMEIRAGTGGDEASLFAADLFRL
jgi:peptide chain release factor 1